MNAQHDGDIRVLLMMLVRHFHWLALGAIWGAALGILSFCFLIKPNFTAESKIYITDSSIANTGTFLATDPHLLNELIERCELDLTWQQLKNMLEVSVLPNTNLISIRVTSKSPRFSANIANSLAAASTQFIPNTMRTGSARVLTTAVIPSKSDGLTPLQVAALSCIAGGGLTAVALLLWSLLADPVLDSEDLSFRYQLPVLGEIPARSFGRTKKLCRQRCRDICHILEAQAAQTSWILLSAAEQSGCEPLCRMLAAYFSKFYGRVLLVERQSRACSSSRTAVKAPDSLLLKRHPFPGVDTFSFPRCSSEAESCEHVQEIEQLRKDHLYRLIFCQENALFPRSVPVILVIRRDHTRHRAVREALNRLHLTDHIVTGFLVLE